MDQFVKDKLIIVIVTISSMMACISLSGCFLFLGDGQKSTDVSLASAKELKSYAKYLISKNKDNRDDCE